MTCRKMSIKQKEKFAFNLIRGFCVCVWGGGTPTADCRQTFALPREEAEAVEEEAEAVEEEAEAVAKATTAKQQ